MAVRNKYGGYRNKTRSMADSGGLSMYSAGLVQQKNTPDNKSSPIVPHHAIPDITVPTETGDKLTPTQGKGFSRIPLRHACKIHEHDYHYTSMLSSNSKEIHIMHPCKRS